MISSKDLTPEQVAALKSWASQGDQLPDIQAKLKEEFGLNTTYMDTRFLVLDLGIEIQKDEEEASAAPVDDLVSPEPAESAGGGGRGHGGDGSGHPPRGHGERAHHLQRR